MTSRQPTASVRRAGSSHRDGSDTPHRLESDAYEHPLVAPQLKHL